MTLLVAKESVANNFEMRILDHPAMAPGSGRQTVYLGNLGIVAISGEIPCMFTNNGWYTNWCPQCGIGTLCDFKCRGPLGFWVKLVPKPTDDPNAPLNYWMQYMPNPAINWDYGSLEELASNSSPEQWVTFPQQSMSSPQLSPTLLQQPPPPPVLVPVPQMPIPMPEPQRPQPLMLIPTGDIMNNNNNDCNDANNFATRRPKPRPNFPRRFITVQRQQQSLSESSKYMTARSTNNSASGRTADATTEATQLANNMQAMNINQNETGNRTKTQKPTANSAPGTSTRDNPRPGPSAGPRQQRPPLLKTPPGATYDQNQTKQVSFKNATATASVGIDEANNNAASAEGDCKKNKSSGLEPTIFKRLFCGFCYRNGERREFYRAHSLRDPIGRIVCPVLLKYRCGLCGSTGQNAHTESYCTRVDKNEDDAKRQQRAKPNFKSMWAGRRNATGVIVRKRTGFPGSPARQQGSLSTGSGRTSSRGSRRTTSTSTTNSY